MPSFMITASNISKLYQIYTRPLDQLKETLSRGSKRLHKDFWALRKTTLSIEQGETIGIIGPNGCGKSTLLQILCGILEPTTGRVVRKGRVAALLELGTGFIPEFSGRENVLINGELMGLSKSDIERSLPSIERFAEIGEFIDHPVKTYSSGMYVRLAFATAIHSEPDIFVVDETLAVGDAVFANRCIRKFQQLQEKGVTIVLVSHDLGLVKQICSRALFLLDGKIQEDGSPSFVVNRYIGKVLENGVTSRENNYPVVSSRLPSSNRHGDRLAEVTEVELYGPNGNPTRSFVTGDSICARITAYFHRDQPYPVVGMLIRTRTGMDVFGTNTKLETLTLPSCKQGDTLEVSFSFNCWLTAQEYTLTVATQHPNGNSHDWLDDVITFQVHDPRQLAGVANLHPTVKWHLAPGKTTPVASPAH